MKKSVVSSKSIVPVMLAFFTMGFVDLVGIAANYVKQDFALSDTAANSFTVMVFFWFFVFSVPTGMLMNKIGRKNTVLLSMVVTFVGLLIPLLVYNDISMFFAFSFIGIGNTLMQVSLNPLLASLVSEERQPSYLTLGQFIKSVASFVAPLIAVHAAVQMGNWKLLFLIFAVIDVMAVFCLLFTPIVEVKAQNNSSTFKECILLLKNGVILLLFVGILVHVGIDVGVNISAPKLLQERVGLSLSEAGYATSVFFLFRTLGCFSGTIIMAKFSPVKFLACSVVLMFLGVVVLMFAFSEVMIYTCVAIIGIGNSNVFSVIFSHALLYMPSRNNEISGLMIMGITGGAVFPVLMGMASDGMGGQIGTVIILAVCVAYLLFLSGKMNKCS